MQEPRDLPIWEDLSILSRNRLPARASFIPFADRGECERAAYLYANKEQSSRLLLLNGRWQFGYWADAGTGGSMPGWRGRPRFPPAGRRRVGKSPTMSTRSIPFPPIRPICPPAIPSGSTAAPCAAPRASRAGSCCILPGFPAPFPSTSTAGSPDTAGQPPARRIRPDRSAGGRRQRADRRGLQMVRRQLP